MQFDLDSTRSVGTRGLTPPARRGRRELLGACAILVVATLVCFHKLALHPVDVLVGPQKRGHNDLTDYFIASREFAAQAVQQGELPFWNPYICLGEPFAGNPQAALYYPPNWITLVWDARYSLSWLLVAHHFFAGLGAYCLARRYGLSWVSGMLAGVVFVAAPFLVAQSAEGHYPQICAVAWIPWSFLAYESFLVGCVRHASLEAKLAGSGARGVAGIVACLSLCFFCGHAQETYYLVLLLTGSVAFDAARLWWRGPGGAARILIVGWCRAGLLTAGLVAIDLLPTFLATLRSARPSLHDQSSAYGWTAMTLSSLCELIDPFALTRPELWEGGTTPFWEKVFHFGVLPLALAIIGVLFGFRKSGTKRMAVIGLVTVAFALGACGAAYDTLASVIPGLSWFRVPSRILFFTSFSTAMLAGCGWEVLRRATSTRRTLAACLSAGVLGGCLVELTRFSMQVTDTAVLRPLESRDPKLAALLADSAPAARVLAVSEVLSDGEAARLGVAKVTGYEPAGPAAYLAVNRMLQGESERPLDPMGFLPGDPLDLDRRWLEQLGVRYAIRMEHESVGDLPEGWSLVGAGQLRESLSRRGGGGEALVFSCEVLELESALPRAYVVGQARPCADFGQFVTDWPSMNPRQEVALVRDVLPAGQRAGFAPAEIVSESTQGLVVAANLDAPGYLVLGDLWFPGWTASIDGEPSISVLQANGTFRAVPLPRGEHRVAFRYVPRGLCAGALMSAMTLLIVLWPLVVSAARRSKVFQRPASRVAMHP